MDVVLVQPPGQDRRPHHLVRRGRQLRVAPHPPHLRGDRRGLVLVDIVSLDQPGDPIQGRRPLGRAEGPALREGGGRDRFVRRRWRGEDGLRDKEEEDAEKGRGGAGDRAAHGKGSGSGSVTDRDLNRLGP